MSEDIITQYERDAITRRLTVIRTMVTGDNKAEFARRLGILPSRWANLERGLPLTMNVAFMLLRLREIEGLTMSYLTHGMYDGIKPSLRKRLETLENKLFPSDGALNRRRIKEEEARKLRHQLAELESELGLPAPRSNRGSKGL